VRGECEAPGNCDSLKAQFSDLSARSSHSNTHCEWHQRERRCRSSSPAATTPPSHTVFFVRNKTIATFFMGMTTNGFDSGYRDPPTHRPAGPPHATQPKLKRASVVKCTQFGAFPGSFRPCGATKSKRTQEEKKEKKSSKKCFLACHHSGHSGVGGAAGHVVCRSQATIHTPTSGDPLPR